MKNKISTFFSSAPMLFLIAFLLASGFWFWVTFEKSPIETIVINNVPVTLNLPADFSDGNYQVYGNSEYTVDVTITGKKFAIQSLTAADLNATALVSNIDSAGTKSIPITVTPKSSKIVNYEISSLSKNSINVFMDISETREFPVKVSVNTVNAIIENGLKLGEATPSLPNIKITGPSTELDKIDYVLASITLQGKITESKKYTPEISIKEVDSENTIKYSEFESVENFNVYIPLYVQKELPLKLTINNIPENKKSDITFSKENIVFWVPLTDADSISDANIKTIDYKDLTGSQNQFALTFDECEYTQVIPINTVWCSVKITDKTENS